MVLAKTQECGGSVTKGLIIACAVCYGEGEGPIADALNLSVLTLLGILGVVLCSFTVFFVYLIRRAKHVRVHGSSEVKKESTLC